MMKSSWGTTLFFFFTTLTSLAAGNDLHIRGQDQPLLDSTVDNQKSGNEGQRVHESIADIQAGRDALRTQSLAIRATPTAPAAAGSTVLCGPSNGNTVCLNNLCCSSYGNCGIGDGYCGTGCQGAFGRCGTATSAFKPGPTGSTTTCGPNNNNAVCAPGYCCSSAGFCGKEQSYCADPNCQFNFGTCDSNQSPLGSSTESDPRPPIGNLTYSRDIYHCAIPNVVALTFDDGPLNYTVAILDLLKKYNFRATFFICGNNLGKGMIDSTAPYPDIIRRMVNEGHQVASHTWSHYNLDTLTTAQRVEQIVKNERAIANILGYYPTYLRPPYSGCQNTTGCQADMEKLGYHRVYFDFDTDDYLNDTPLKIQLSKDLVDAKLQNTTQGKDLLSIQHDIDRQGANLTEHYFQSIQAKGWKGVSAGQCLNDPPTNWYRTPGSGSAFSTPSVASQFTLSNETIFDPNTATAMDPTEFGIEGGGQGPNSGSDSGSGTDSSSAAPPSSSGKSSSSRMSVPSILYGVSSLLVGLLCLQVL